MVTARDFEDDFEREVEHWPGVSLRLERNGTKKHNLAHLTFGAKKGKFPYPSSPSDENGPLRAVTIFKRKLASMGAHRHDDRALRIRRGDVTTTTRIKPTPLFDQAAPMPVYHVQEIAPPEPPAAPPPAPVVAEPEGATTVSEATKPEQKPPAYKKLSTIQGADIVNLLRRLVDTGALQLRMTDEGKQACQYDSGWSDDRVGAEAVPAFQGTRTNSRRSAVATIRTELFGPLFREPPPAPAEYRPRKVESHPKFIALQAAVDELRDVAGKAQADAKAAAGLMDDAQRRLDEVKAENERLKPLADKWMKFEELRAA